jgi:hypothetical protein
MLKGKVILVTSAIVTEVGKQGRTAIATGRQSFSPTPITIAFSKYEKNGGRLTRGDIVTFKGRCTGMAGAIGFESCILISSTRPVPNSP